MIVLWYIIGIVYVIGAVMTWIFYMSFPNGFWFRWNNAIHGAIFAVFWPFCLLFILVI